METVVRGLKPLTFLKLKALRKASEDFRYLLNRGYPRKASLELVGNRYELTSDQRHLLHRSVFSDRDSDSRRKRKIALGQIAGRNLLIDGYNVLITIEAGLSGRPLVLGDDGFIRDISGLSKDFKKTARTLEALRLVLDVLKRKEPKRTLFLFDSPMSRSGELAQEVRNLMEREKLPGDALAVRVPEKILIGFPATVATSDTAIIDQSRQVVDLAGYTIGNLFRRRRRSAAPHSKTTYPIIRWRRRRSPVGER